MLINQVSLIPSPFGVIASEILISTKSHTSPIPSLSISDWSGLYVSGQLSIESGIPSPSKSGTISSSQLSGILSLSVSLSIS